MTMQTTLLTTAELLRLDAAVGNLLDTTPKDSPNARLLLQDRREIRAELERRHVAANN
jgi:hypothetical protein